MRTRRSPRNQEILWRALTPPPPPSAPMAPVLAGPALIADLEAKLADPSAILGRRQRMDMARRLNVAKAREAALQRVREMGN